MYHIYLKKNQDKITRFAINRLNDQLNGKLIIKGNVSLSLFAGFPNIAMKLDSAGILDTDSDSTNQLLGVRPAPDAIWARGM